MGNLKKLLSNKNFVTLLGAILIVVVLFLFYRWRVSSAIQPVELPYALHALEQGAQITPQDVGVVEVPYKQLRGDVITNVSSVYNNFASCFIPSGSLFFMTQKDGSGGNVTTKSTSNADFLYKVKEGDVAYYFSVNMENTYGNSFFPDKYFDIYLRIYKDNESNIITFGRFVNNVKILAVRDSSARDVFATTQDRRTPSQLIFAVNKEINAYLRVAEKLQNVEIIIVPTAADLKYQDSEVPAARIINVELKEYLEPFLEDLTANELTSGPTTTNTESTVETTE